MTVTVRPWDDAVEWNKFVAATPNAHFNQSWEWGDLAPAFGSRAVRLGAVCEGRLVGAAQVFVHPLKLFGGTHLQIPRGPAIHQPAMEILGTLLDGVRDFGADLRAAGVRVEPAAVECSASWTASLRSLGFRPTYPPSQPRSSWVLDITPDEDALLAGMKQKTRYNIRLAARKGVEVEEGTRKDFDTFLGLYRETADRDDFLIHEPLIYERMFSLFGAEDNFRLLLARHQDEVIAAASLVRFGATCWYMHGASSNRRRNVMAPYLLQWAAIQRAREWGCTLYDFRGIPDILREDQDMYGVYRFKEGFGGRTLTTMDTWAIGYRPLVSGLWQLYSRARFDLASRLRRRRGLPIRQFA